MSLTRKTGSYLSPLLPLACNHLLGNVAQFISFDPVVLNPDSGLTRISQCKAHSDNPCWHTASSSIFRLCCELPQAHLYQIIIQPTPQSVSFPTARNLQPISELSTALQKLASMPMYPRASSVKAALSPSPNTGDHFCEVLLAQGLMTQLPLETAALTVGLQSLLLTQW